MRFFLPFVCEVDISFLQIYTLYKWLAAINFESQVCDCCALGAFFAAKVSITGQRHCSALTNGSKQGSKDLDGEHCQNHLTQSSWQKLLERTSNHAPAPRECRKLQSFVRKRDGSPRLQLVHPRPPPTLILYRVFFYWSPKSFLCVGV